MHNHNKKPERHEHIGRCAECAWSWHGENKNIGHVEAERHAKTKGHLVLWGKSK